MGQGEKTRKILFFLLKIALAAAVAGILFSRGQQEIFKAFRTFDFRYLLPAFLLTYLQFFFSALRWHSLAKVLQIRLTLPEAFSLTMQGNFFSLVIPGGAIGGDVVKMAVLGKRTPAGSKVEGVFTVFTDRVIGMAALFSLALLLLLSEAGTLMKIRWGSLPQSTFLNVLFTGGTALLCLAGLGASLLFFFHKALFKLPGVTFLFQKLDGLAKGAFSRMTEAATSYAGHWRRLLCWIILTVFLIHLLAVLPFMLLLQGLGVQFSCLTVITAVVIGNIAGLIPLFPGGIGIRDLVTVTLLAAGSIGSGDAKTAQLLSTAIMLLTYLSGGLFFIFDIGKGGKK